MAIELVFETHSTTEDNERGCATGWRPGRLSEQGRVQARQLGRRRIGDRIAAVFSSDLARAAETASLAFWEGQRVLLIGHVATRWGLDHFIGGAGLEDLAGEDFAWREGWEYLLR
jgi:bisphosphoglycerate-dependent phosphoglycerate mutase